MKNDWINQELLKRIRTYYDIPNEVSDDVVLDTTKDSFGKAAIQMGIAVKDLMSPCVSMLNSACTILEKMLHKSNTK